MCNTYLRLIYLLSVASVASADILYHVTVDTASLIGTNGSLDFQFNPGPLVSQAAFLQILDFGGSGIFAGTPAVTGNVNGGPLPTALYFNNGSSFNDYFHGFLFGSNFVFDVGLSGPALNSPDGISTSGSTFVVSIFSDSSGLIPVLTTDSNNGFTFLINLNLDGTTTITNFSPQTAVVLASPVAESNTAILFGMTSLFCGVLWGWRPGPAVRHNRQLPIKRTEAALKIDHHLM